MANTDNIRKTDGVLYKVRPQTDKVKVSVYNSDGGLERETMWNVNTVTKSEAFALPSNAKQDVIVTEYDASNNIVIVVLYPSVFKQMRGNNNYNSR